jgi:hypothetical protein
MVHKGNRGRSGSVSGIDAINRPPVSFSDDEFGFSLLAGKSSGSISWGTSQKKFGHNGRPFGCGGPRFDPQDSLD